MAQTNRRPNILLITTDTQRCDTIAAYGNPHAVSPHLDRLAREGVTFDDAYTPSPVCMPARCSLMTGTHAPVHGAIENGMDRRPHLTMVIPDLLVEAGYHTIMVGKTHFGPVPETFHVRRLLAGKSGGDYERHLARHGYRHVDTHPTPVPEELFRESFLVDQTIAEIDAAAARGRPFFAFCSMLSPHGPHTPPGRWATVYDDRPLPPLNYRPHEEARHPRHLRRLVGLDERTGGARHFRDGLPDMEKIDADRRLYYGFAAYCDHQIGRLIDHLDRAQLREDTLVLFTSDHGHSLYDHGFHDKHNYYDESWRVPLIVSQPGTLPQGERRGFAIWNDLTATILSAAGTASPWVQGFDLYAPLVAGAESPRRCGVGTLYKSCALATRDWKLEYYFEEATGRLFDRRRDPDEQTDLYDSPAHRELRQALVQALLTWRADLIDVEWHHKHTHGGGPVAERTVRYVRDLRGTDAEQRLNAAAEAIDGAFASL